MTAPNIPNASAAGMAAAAPPDSFEQVLQDLRDIAASKEHPERRRAKIALALRQIVRINPVPTAAQQMSAYGSTLHAISTVAGTGSEMEQLGGRLLGMIFQKSDLPATG